MKTNLVACALALAAVGLSACEGGPDTRANTKLCADFKGGKAAAALTPGDGAATVDECTKRWAYSLATSRDDADIVAEAVANACNLQLTRWNQQVISQPDGAAESMSITTGEPTSPLAEHNTFTRSRALFYVVQARAGRCAPPPITNGAPDGLG